PLPGYFLTGRRPNIKYQAKKRPCAIRAQRRRRAVPLCLEKKLPTCTRINGRVAAVVYSFFFPRRTPRGISKTRPEITRSLWRSEERRVGNETEARREMHARETELNSA